MQQLHAPKSAKSHQRKTIGVNALSFGADWIFPFHDLQVVSGRIPYDAAMSADLTQR